MLWELLELVTRLILWTFIFFVEEKSTTGMVKFVSCVCLFFYLSKKKTTSKQIAQVDNV